MEIKTPKENEIISLIYQIIGYVSMLEDHPSLKEMTESIEKLMDAKSQKKGCGKFDTRNRRCHFHCGQTALGITMFCKECLDAKSQLNEQEKGE